MEIKNEGFKVKEPQKGRILERIAPTYLHEMSDGSLERIIKHLSLPEGYRKAAAAELQKRNK